jgi:hypothetical protein
MHEVLQTTHGGDGTDDDCERGYRFDRLSMRRRRYRRQSNFSCSSKTSFIQSRVRPSLFGRRHRRVVAIVSAFVILLLVVVVSFVRTHHRSSSSRLTVTR